MSNRDRWKSNSAFIFAAIGSAVGLGNIWRFPYLAYQYGGGSFVLPYLISLFFLGLPLLVLEMALGQKLQKGAVGSFQAIHPRLSGIGSLAVANSFFIVIYHAILMSWTLLYLMHSFEDPLPWKAVEKDYFFNDILGISKSINEQGNVSGSLLLALSAVWALIYLCIRKGISSVGRIVMITVPLPLILLAILFLRALSLEGSLDGIIYYIQPKFEHLLSLELWMAAAGQAFFSLSLAMGILIAYSSFNQPKTDIVKDSLIIVVANALISIFSGFVVFAMIGYILQETGQSIEQLSLKGPSLAFIVFAKALSLLPWGANFFAVLFFLSLLTMGIDSVFSYVEALIVVICDEFNELRKEQIAFWVCVLCFASGFIFITEAGFYYFQLIDHYVIDILLVLTGILECLAISWCLGAERVRLYINQTSQEQVSPHWNFTVSTLIPLTMAALLIFRILQDLQENYQDFPTWAIRTSSLIVCIPVAFCIYRAIWPKGSCSRTDFPLEKK